MPKYVIWCEGEPPCPGGQGSPPTEKGFLRQKRGSRPSRPVVVPDPDDTMALSNLLDAKTVFDALNQPKARLLVVLE